MRLEGSYHSNECVCVLTVGVAGDLPPSCDDVVLCPDHTLKGKGLVAFATFLGTH